MNEKTQQMIEDALSKSKLELKQLENDSYEAALSGDIKKEKEIQEEIKTLNGRISTLQSMFLDKEVPAIAPAVNPDWGGMPEIKKEEIKKASYCGDNISCILYTNQWVAEIRTQNRTTMDKDAKDFIPYRQLRHALYRRKEGQAIMALVEWLAENKNGFLFAISSGDFIEEFNLTEPSYRTAIDSLIFYGILKPTLRVAKGTNGVYGRIFIFEKGLPPEELPQEKYNPKNKEHKDTVRKIKAMYGL